MATTSYHLSQSARQVLPSIELSIEVFDPGADDVSRSLQSKFHRFHRAISLFQRILVLRVLQRRAFRHRHNLLWLG